MAEVASASVNMSASDGGAADEATCSVETLDGMLLLMLPGMASGHKLSYSPRAINSHNFIAYFHCQLITSHVF